MAIEKRGDHATPRWSQPHPGKLKEGVTDSRGGCGGYSARGVSSVAVGGQEHFSAPNGSGDVRLVVSQGDLESVASLFGCIATMRQGDQSHLHERDPGALLDAHVRDVMRTMKERLSSLREGAMQDVEVVRAKFGLYDICFDELILITSATAPALSRALKTLRDAHDNIVQDMPGIVRRAIVDYEKEVSCLREGKERDADEAAELVEAAQALERETVAHHRELQGLHRRLKELEEENASLREKGVVCASLARPPAPPRNPTAGMSPATTTSSMMTLLATPSAALCDRSGWRGAAPDPRPGSCRTVDFAAEKDTGVSVAGDGTAAAAAMMRGERELSLKQLQDVIGSIYASKEKYDRNCDVQRLPSQTLARHLDDFLLHRYGMTSTAKAQAAALRKGVERFREQDNAVMVFDLTLRNEVDEKFRLEQQHLERTVVEIIRSRIRERVARHHKNEKEDRPNNGRLGGDIRQRGREFASASSATIDYLLRIQTRREAPLAAADWRAIVRHVYKGSTAHVQTVGVLVREAVSVVQEEGSRNGAVGSKKGRQGDAGGVERSSVPFGVFMQVLLGYRLHGRLRWLRSFKEDFREVDGDGDGVVNPNEFMTLAKRTLRHAQRPIASRPARQNGKYPSSREKSGRHRATAKGGQGGNEEQASARLKAADPHGLGRITFSQCFEHLLLS